MVMPLPDKRGTLKSHMDKVTFYPGHVWRKSNRCELCKQSHQIWNSNGCLLETTFAKNHCLLTWAKSRRKFWNPCLHFTTVSFALESLSCNYLGFQEGQDWWTISLWQEAKTTPKKHQSLTGQITHTHTHTPTHTHTHTHEDNYL
jgi:hypothetical protein